MIRRPAVVLATILATSAGACGNQPATPSPAPAYQQRLPCPVPGVQASAVARLPDGFDAVQLWRCTYQFPRFGSPRTASPGEAEWPWRTVDRAESAFPSVISALRATPQSAPPSASHVCPATAVLPTTLVLVDRAGKAVAPALPTDAICGRLASQLTTAIEAVKWETVRANNS